MAAPTARDDPADVTPQALKPTRPLAFIRRVAGPLWIRVGMAAILEVPGRRTGTPRRVTLLPIELAGSTYLLSFTGVTFWVRNLRAAGRAELRRKGQREAFTAVEVDGDERDRVIAAYLARTPKSIRRDFDRRPGAADHPVFRVDPIS